MPRACGPRHLLPFGSVAANVCSIQVVQVVAAAFTARVRVFNFPCTSCTQRGIVAAAHSLPTEMAFAISSFEYIVQTFRREAQLVHPFLATFHNVGRF